MVCFFEDYLLPILKKQGIEDISIEVNPIEPWVFEEEPAALYVLLSSKIIVDNGNDYINIYESFWYWWTYSAEAIIKNNDLYNFINKVELIKESFNN